ncbi:polysaccharide biosynthesis C-terminal domain-containing protein [Paraburkholderia sp. HD33-4]|uniref:polysaccharide biosynthesis C-terminal domain-containing protein n=1 Tax=Paraburkholderia sp. HD33-4 TaxID=2883242 RepID=UPI001F2C6074|nr:polysaccharide biosynthesis C-terminal domain-containing protein [Paraburkholderia sp. HD33-4]
MKLLALEGDHAQSELIRVVLGAEGGLTRELLALFRPEFADAGIVALRVLALSAAFIVLVAMAPTYLKYRGQNRAIYASVATAACVQVALLLLLVPRMGATGAALAYAIAMCGLYGNLARVARRELRQMQNQAAPQTG